MEQLWLRGGFPLSYLAVTERASVLWRRNFIQTYIQLGPQANPQLIQRFWNMLASFHGNIWNAENFARSLGITGPTVNRYLDFMEGAYMIRVLHPWYKNIKKRLVKSPKVYVRDSGLLHVLSGLDNKQALLNHVQAGASWEGFVIEQIVNSLSGEFTPWYYRTHQGTESDMLLEKNNSVVAAIEIKLGTNPKISRGFRTAVEDTGAPKAYVIANTERPYRVDETITVMNLGHFIRNELSEL